MIYVYIIKLNLLLINTFFLSEFHYKLTFVEMLKSLLLREHFALIINKELIIIKLLEKNQFQHSE
jgi:hypothetical protein